MNQIRSDGVDCSWHRQTERKPTPLPGCEMFLRRTAAPFSCLTNSSRLAGALHSSAKAFSSRASQSWCFSRTPELKHTHKYSVYFINWTTRWASGSHMHRYSRILFITLNHHISGKIRITTGIYRKLTDYYIYDYLISLVFDSTIFLCFNTYNILNISRCQVLIKQK